jgi:hypothetical protein
MPNIAVKDRQSLLDIGMQESGTAEAAFSLATLNNLSVTEDLLNRQIVLSAPVIDKATVTFFKKENRSPATAETLLPEDERDEGIDFWTIEEDFIVD